MGDLIKAVRCHRYAALDEHGKRSPSPDRVADVLILDNVDRPVCGDREILVRTNYVGIQYPDTLQALGLYQKKPALPYIPGMDLTGTIVDVGAEIHGLKLRTRIVAQVPIGALAEIVKVSINSSWVLPTGSNLSHYANLGRNYFPAYHSLRVIGEVTQGDLVLIDGASGGVGMAAIELAKAMGALVIGGVSTPEKKELLTNLGADRVLCYGNDRESYRRFKDEVKQAAIELGHPTGVDVVVDVVQGELFEAALVSSVRPLGKICLVGFTGGQKPIRPGVLLIKQAAVFGSIWADWAAINPERHRENVNEIINLLATGMIKPRVNRIFPLQEFIKAFELFENNQGHGNTVICVRED